MLEMFLFVLDGKYSAPLRSLIILREEVMNKTIKKLMSLPDFEIYQGKVSVAQISEITTKTGVVLPSDYVEFLKACGFIIWFGHAVNGVYDDKDSRFPESFNFSAITQTLEARQDYQIGKYPYYDNSLVIGKDDMGGYFLLLSATKPAGQPSVAWVNMDDHWVVTQTWDSFESFLETQLSNI
jgi:hypothetical protein